MPSNTNTIAFLGATGGVVNSAMVHALNAGYTCLALVRTPEKLRKQLVEQNISNATIDSQLIITQGDATAVADLKKMLVSHAPSSLPATIVTGVGGAPSIKFKISSPLNFVKNDQPSLCGDSAKALVAAVKELQSENVALKSQKPALIMVSTTGISRGPEDVPFGMRFLYHGILHEPHVDKKVMEATFRDEMAEGDGSVFRIVSGVRPTLLAGTANVTDAKGLQSVKAGTESQPATGYTVKRSDVGEWLFRNLIHDEQARSRWEGEMCSLTS
jgi:hypothetical protein